MELDLSTETARVQQAQYGIAERDFQAWRIQKVSADRRGIPFRFSLVGWWLWWKLELRLKGEGSCRGKRRGMFVMARNGDQGAYEPGNVYCATMAQNLADVPAERRAAGVAKIKATREANGHPLGQHLMVRGDGHPRSKAIITPKGRFGSMALAAEAFGISRQAVCWKLKTKRDGWSMEAEDKGVSP